MLEKTVYWGVAAEGGVGGGGAVRPTFQYNHCSRSNDH